MKSYYKAGLIGASVAILFTIISRALDSLSFTGSSYDYTSLFAYFAIYFVTGLLAVFWSRSPKSILLGGVTGAQAGFIVGVLDGVLSVFLDSVISYFKNRSPNMVDLAFLGSLIEAGIYRSFIGIGIAGILGGFGGIVYVLINLNQDGRNIPENNATTNTQFLVEWLLLNSAGWIIGCLFVWFIRASNIEAIYHGSFSVWQATLGWLLLGISIGIFQWLKLRRFGINIFMWLFVTALGISLFEPLSRGMESLLYGLQVIPQGKVNLGEFIGNIDIGKNITILSGGVIILLDGFITSGLQAVIMRRVIPKPWLWVKANMFGLLLLAVIVSLVYFFKHIVLNAIYFGDRLIYSSKLDFLSVLVDIAIILLPVLIALEFSAIISLPTGKLLIELRKTETNS